MLALLSVNVIPVQSINNDLKQQHMLSTIFAKKFQDTLAIGTHYTKRFNVLFLASKDMAHFDYISVHVAHHSLVYLGDLR